MLIGLSAVVWYGNVRDVAGGNTALLVYLIKDLSTNKFLQSLLLLGLLCVMMSTIDSFLLSIGIVMTCNVIKPLFFSHRDSFDQIKWARCITFFVGILVILFSYFNVRLCFIRLIFWNDKTLSPAVVRRFLSSLLLLYLVLGTIDTKTSKKMLITFFIGFAISITVSKTSGAAAAFGFAPIFILLSLFLKIMGIMKMSEKALITFYMGCAIGIIVSKAPTTTIACIVLSSLIIFPFILGVIGIQTSERMLAAFCISFVTSIISIPSLTPFNTYAQKTEIWVISLLIGIICFLVTHYRQYGKFIIQHRT